MSNLYMFDSTKRQVEKVSSAITNFVSTTYQLGTYRDAPFDLRVSASCTPDDKQAVGYLHGNLIAHRTHPPQPSFNTQKVVVPGETIERWEMSMCGWPTDLTRRRLNVICNELFGRRPFAQINKLQWYLREPASPHPPTDGKDIYILSDTIVVLHIFRRQSPLKPTVIVEIDKEIV